MLLHPEGDADEHGMHDKGGAAVGIKGCHKALCHTAIEAPRNELNTVFEKDIRIDAWAFSQRNCSGTIRLKP